MNRTIINLYIAFTLLMSSNLIFANYPSGEQLLTEISKSAHDDEGILSVPDMGRYKVIHLNFETQQLKNPNIQLQTECPDDPEESTLTLYKEKNINGTITKKVLDFEQRPYKIERAQGTENIYKFFVHCCYKNKHGKEKIALDIIGKIQLEKVTA